MYATSSRAYRQIARAGRPGRGRTCRARAVRARVGELLETLRSLAREPTVITSDETRVRAGEQPDLYGSADRLTADTGWMPQIPLEYRP